MSPEQRRLVEDVEKDVDKALAILRERCPDALILVSYSFNQGDNSQLFYRGHGNAYASMGMAQEYLNCRKAHTFQQKHRDD